MAPKKEMLTRMAQKRMEHMKGEQDSRGMQGILSRGANVYNSTSNAAHSGGGKQFGRPSQNKQNLFNKMTKKFGNNLPPGILKQMNKTVEMPEQQKKALAMAARRRASRG